MCSKQERGRRILVLSQDQDVVKFNCTKAISTDTHKLVRAMYQQDVQNNFDMNVSPCYML